jgi:DNA-binding transcriptional MerR regulator
LMDKASGAYRTISEVADELDIPQHVLRFWETRFPQIRPMKRSGGRRYYRPGDVLLLRGIRRLLYGEGYTIRGVQRILSSQGIAVVQQAGGATGAEVALAEMQDPAADTTLQAEEPVETELTSFGSEDASSEFIQPAPELAVEARNVSLRETHSEATQVPAQQPERLPPDQAESQERPGLEPQTSAPEARTAPVTPADASARPSPLASDQRSLLQAALDELRACARHLDSLRDDSEPNHQTA